VTGASYPYGGKVALVTGAGGGIGRASALAFARHGANVAVIDVNDAAGRETVAMMAALEGGRGHYIHADVSVSADVQAMVAETVATFGHLDFAHNNAGVTGATHPVAEMPEDEWDRVMGIMLRGVFLGMKYEIPHILAAGGGAIVNTASGAGIVAYPEQSAYVTSKHGVIGLTKTAALEYGKHNIRINAVCPGTVWSPMVEAAITQPGLEAQLIALHPIGRIGTADEIANAVMWLCSDDASFMLGHSLSVDGGYVVP
jgi:NAD(P)-dependent dehydrogenase (short-subunit alcohol dehydrogenase family)